MISISRRFLLVSSALAISGCAALPGGGPAPLDTFDLQAVNVESTAARRSRVQLLVAEPTALKTIDSENIVIRPTGATLEYLRGAQWADRLPRLVQAKLVEALQGSGRFGGVGKPGEGLAIDYQLLTEVRAFGIRLDGTPRAEVRLHVKLLNDRNGVVRAERTFSAEAAMNGTGNNAYVAALDRAFADVTRQIVGWTLGST